MKQSRKIKLALPRRIAAWDDMKCDGMAGPRTKIIKKMAYHRPGSQNGRKGGR